MAMKGMTSIDAKLYRRNMDSSQYPKPQKPPESLKSNHGRFELFSEAKTNKTELSKNRTRPLAKSDENLPSNSESENFESIGGTLSDGLKSMRMFPVLSSYENINSTNRYYFWNKYLEKHGGVFAIIDKPENTDTKPKQPNDDSSITKVHILK